MTSRASTRNNITVAGSRRRKWLWELAPVLFGSDRGDRWHRSIKRIRHNRWGSIGSACEVPSLDGNPAHQRTSREYLSLLWSRFCRHRWGLFEKWDFSGVGVLVLICTRSRGWCRHSQALARYPFNNWFALPRCLASEQAWYSCRDRPGECHKKLNSTEP